MTQNQIIEALIRKTQNARNKFLETQADSDNVAWGRYLNAIDVLCEILEDDKRKTTDFLMAAKKIEESPDFLQRPPFKPDQIAGSVKRWDEVN